MKTLTHFLIGVVCWLPFCGSNAATCVTPPAGLVSWWQGGYDSRDSVSTNHATLLNGAAYGPGLSGAGFQFLPGNAYLSAPDSATWAFGTNEFTIELWAHFTATNGSRVFVAHDQGGGAQNKWIFWMDAGALKFHINGAPGVANIGTAPFTPFANRWYHLALTRASSNYTFFINGSPVSTNIDSRSIPDATGPLTIGQAEGNYFFNGLMDEISIYTRALGAGEIASIYNAAGAGKCYTPASAGTTPFFADFQSGVPLGWSDSRRDDTQPFYFTTFSGRYSTDYQLLTLTNLTPGDSYTLLFDLYVIDSWDGGSQDYFYVGADGVQLMRETFNNFSASQTYSRAPDQGRSLFGFDPSWNDSIYRSIRLTFVPSNTMAQLAFAGQGLSAVPDESWGLDNVRVLPTADAAQTFINDATLPEQGSTNVVALDTFVLAPSRPLTPAAANSAASYSLREAGGNGTLGDGDDIIVALTPSYTSGFAVTVSVNNAPLQPGRYRFQTTPSLTDTNGGAVAVFTREFTITHPVLGRVENTANATIATATPLPTTESPAGSGFFTAFAVGSFASTSDVDFWRFDAEAGDRLTVRLQTELGAVNPQIQLQNASGGNLHSVGGSGSLVSFANYTFSSPGTYYLRVWSTTARSPYALRLDQARGTQSEAEANDTPAAANTLALSISPGLYQGRVIGALPPDDPEGDYFSLGTLNVGNPVAAFLNFPTGSVLNAENTVLRLYVSGSTGVLASSTSGNLNYTVTSNGLHYLRVVRSVPATADSFRANYLANVAISDGVPPAITATTLPAESGQSAGVVDRFRLTFSEDLVPAAVSNAANYELRSAGPDALFDTADDAFYSVATYGYTGGLNSDFAITDGPLQPGAYRFTARTNLIDRASNPMAAPFVRLFTVSSVHGFVLEARRNDTLSGAGTISAVTTATPDGTSSPHFSIGVGDAPEGIVAGDFDNDGDNDLAVAVYNGDRINILLNNLNPSSSSTFTSVTNITGLDGCVYLAASHFNADTNLDLVSVNHLANTLTVLIGNGAGGFEILTNYTGFNRPHFLTLGDFNQDSRPDLAVPNYNANTVTVMLGAGDGTFGSRTNYITGSSPMQVRAGHWNNDPHLDLAVANYSAHTVSILLGSATGQFQLATNLPVASNPRSVAFAQVTGDAAADLLVLNNSDYTLSVYPNFSAGDAPSRFDYGTGVTDPYELTAVDLNADGRLDIVIPGYGNDTISILFNDQGQFTNRLSYAWANGPICTALADLTGDALPDLAITRYHSDAITIFAGNSVSPLSASPTGSGLATGYGRGNISSTADVDYFRFTGSAGHRAVVAIETVGNPVNSSLHVEIQRHDGTALTTFNSDNVGYGQSVPVTLPYSGAYYARISYNNDFQGEYRLRVSTVAPPARFETEANNTLAQANTLAPTATVTNPMVLRDQMAGYISIGDPGDWYRLGHLAQGTTISLLTAQPVTSGFAPLLTIHNAAGNIVASAVAGATNLAWTVPAGQGGAYYARISSSPTGYAPAAQTALRLDGSDDSLDFGNWFNHQAFSVVLWINPAASQTAWADILDNNHTASRSWVLQYANTGSRFTWGLADGSAGINIDLLPNQWQQLVLTRDSANVNRAYLNGALIGTAAGTGEIFYDGTQYLRLGRWGSGGRHFNGMVDDLRLYNRPLTPSEVTALLADPQFVVPPSGGSEALIAHYPFNEGTGTTAADLSPSNRVATLVNGVTWLSVAPSNAGPTGLLAQYLLQLDLIDTAGPAVVAVTLPPDATASGALWNEFTVSFDEELSPALNALNRVIRSYNGHHYFLSDTAGTWPELQAQAAALGGHLVAINDAAENAFLVSAFASAGTLWIGLSDAATEGAFTWTTGEPFTYSNWNSGEPNNPGSEDYAQILNTGRWNDAPGSTVLRGIIEVAGLTDADADGLPDLADAFPADPRNAFELRSAGPDQVLDTADDSIYDLNSVTYSAGTNVSFYLVDGPLQPGAYRFTVSTSVRDRFGNAMAAPYQRFFTITNLPGFIVENRDNGSAATATSFSPSPGTAPDGSFARHATYPSGGNPYFVLALMVNADTNHDLVVANYGSDSIAFHYGNGDGTFLAASNLPVGSGPIALASGNFTGDTNTDFAVALYGANRVAIVRGDGLGNFVLHTNYPVAANPRVVVAGDFNGDGRPDLATANHSGNSISVLLADTNGSFLPRVDYPTGGSMQGLDAGDVNGDGLLDLVAANYGSSLVHLFLGLGNGAFTNAAAIPIGSNPRPIHLTDLNADTFLDLVTFTVGDDRLRIALGNGDGTFGTNTPYAIGASDMYHIVPADLDLDGWPDLVLPAYGGNRLMTLAGSSNAVMTGLNSYNPGGNPISAAVADFNHDGRPDIASANYSANTVHVFLGQDSEILPESIPSSAIRDGFARGSLWDASEHDYWQFSGKAGDRLSVAIESVGSPGSSGLQVFIDRPDGVNLTSFVPDSSGWGQLRTTLPSSGTYIVRVQPWYDYRGEYRLRITVAAPPTQVEGEDNNSLANANVLTYALTPGRQSAAVLGYLNVGDANGDYFQLGNQTLGTTVTLGLRLPPYSTAVPSLAIYRAGNLLVTNAAGTNLTYTIPSGGDGAYYARVTSSVRGLLAAYVLDIEMADTVPPAITGTTLPLEGTNVFGVLDRFSLSFSEDMLAASVNAAAHYELRNAGADNVFDTSDDQFYTIINSPVYSIGLSASYVITDGPLQPGAYRFVVSTNLTDRPGLALVEPFVRTFVVSNVPGFAYESRNNNSRGSATTLSFAVTNSPDGSYLNSTNIAVGANPYYAAAGFINGDTNVDLVVANFSSQTASVLLGQGNGGFGLATNLPGNNGAIAPLLGYFNSDSNLDLAVLNYNEASVRVYLGGGDGSFVVASNYAVGSQPYNLAAGDFNADGQVDLVVANRNGDSISVLLGLPSGAFQSAATHPAGDGAMSVAVGDVNGDGKLDVVTANSNSDNLSLFLGNGNGTFPAALAIAANSIPRSVVLTDVNQDNKLDLAVANAGDNTLTVMLGNGDGSFQSRVTYASGANDSYGITAGDINGDGWADLLMAGYSNSRLSTFLNRGDGTFEPAVTYALGNNPIGILSTDFNHDGRLDIALVNYSGGNITVVLGNDTELLQQDSDDGLFLVGRARGNLFNSSDVDYYSFSAVVGSRITFAAETPGAPNNSGFRYILYRPDGAALTEFYAESTGRGEGSAIAPVSGTYYLAVLDYHTSTVEYRVRVSVFPGELGIESEDNNNVSQADSANWLIGGGHQTASMIGYIAGNDTSGDYYRLGNLTPGTVVTLRLDRPWSSSLHPVLSVYNSAGVLQTNVPAGTTNLVFTVSVADAYHARVTATSGAGLFGTYVLAMDLFDNVGPAIAGVTLPSAGSTNLGIVDRFTVNVNKDLDTAFNGLNSAKLYNGHAYFLTPGTVSWPSAQASARSYGGDLVTINDAAENEWLLANFGSTFWIGLTDEAQEGRFVWVSGEPVTYTNWNSGEPNNSSNEDYASLIASGKWNDAGISTSYRGIVEVSGSDADGDGLPDLVDVYPNDGLNLFDLRAAGPDGIFDTSDDDRYRLDVASYSGGLALNFTVLDGPLQPGNYRFRVTTSLRDRYGNSPSSTFDHLFTVAGVPYFVLENRTNNLPANATPFVFVEDLLGLRSGGGRGRIADNSDIDFWSFEANAGDSFVLGITTPNNPGNSQLEYQIRHPNGTVLLTYYSPGGEGQTPPLILPTNGTYTVRVDRSQSFYGEYRLRPVIGSSLIQLEAEGNDSLAASTPLGLAVSGETRFANASGFIRSGTDLDYYNLGTITNGSSVFLNVRLPSFSGLIPVVSIYNAANQYQVEAGNGRANDGVAEVRVTQTGTYYAVVRGTDNTAGVTEQYVLDVQVVPTGSVSFPNMQVATIGLPTGGSIQSGQPITFTFAVTNVGSLATPGADWIDRAVMSLNATLGDADDIPLGFIPHNGALAPGQGYAVSHSVTLPDGISGDYYIIVQTDAGNAVNEFLLEGDNITVSSTTFPVALAPYADLLAENLNVAGPDSNGVYTVTWTTANRGTTTAPAGFKERFFVRNVTSGSILANNETTISNALPVDGTIPQVRTFAATNAGNYIVQVTPDSQNNIFEFDAVSHASAEQNTATATFQIVQFFTVSVAGNPAVGGILTGAGTYPVGTVVTVTAVPNTNSLPYQFVNWTEGGTFQSSSTNYSFTLSRDRALVANFTLPSFQVAASNSPGAGGTVAGQGTYFHGTTNLLVASANPGYRFTNWTQNGEVVGLSNVLVTVVQSNRFVVANYTEANTFHVVTTATSPTNVAVVLGAGTFNNGQTTTISAPLVVTNPPNRYTFKEFRLNGAFAGNAASFVKSFSTLDPTNMAYVAHYDAASIRPVLLAAAPVRTNNVLGGFVTATNPVPAMTNLQFTLQFDRAMNTAVEPTITITNLSGGGAPVVPTGGSWLTTIFTNDTYRTPFVALTNGMDGTNRVIVSNARDISNIVMDGTNALALVIDVTPPLHPAIALTSSNSSSATFNWAGYAAPADLSGFRVYLSTNNFNSVTGLAQVTRLSASARSHTYFGLELNRPYYAAMVAVDVAGNATDEVTVVPFVLPSTIPPVVTPQVIATAVDAAQVSWSYNTANLLGFAGFQLYYEETPFTSVQGLTARQVLGSGARSAQVTGLDRTKNYHFAVVGYNNTNGFNPNVTTATWSDPYAGQITANLSIGGGNERIVDILQPITVTSNATLTIQPGTIVRFAAGAGITVQSGRLFANGTALDPIVFTALSSSANWNGIRLESGAGSSLLRHVLVEYGAGLTIDGCAPTVDAFTASFNQPTGLRLLNNATLTTTAALIANNDIGVQQSGPAQLNLRASVIKNNLTNALATGSTTLIATQNWWGTVVPGDIDAGIQGTVNRSAFLASEPLLTPAIGTSNNLTQVGTSNLFLRLACRTAESMRLSEDSTFTAVFFSPFTNAAPFALSAGGGQKTVYAQFRSITGQTSAPVAVTITYITTGPSIASFNLSEGQVISRPVTVTASASAPLGMDVIEFHVDNVLYASQAGGAFSQLFDVRPFTNGVHRVKLLARDTAGNFATLERNVVLAPTPPPAPVITYPNSDLVISSNVINVSGTAERGVSVRLFRNAAVVATGAANSSGAFSFSGIPLVEGENLLVAQAFDNLGTADSNPRIVVQDSGPPAAVVMEEPSYNPAFGLALSWRPADAGERAARYVLFWHTNSFATTNGLIGHVATGSNTIHRLANLPQGHYHFAVVGFDLAGNPSPLSARVFFSHDPVPPSFTIAFDKSSPAGLGLLRMIVTASEPLAQLPSLTLRTASSTPASLTLSNSALNTFEGFLNVTPATPSGLLQFSIAGRDLAGNVFNGAPAGPAMALDVQPPVGRITTSPAGPVQITNSVNVAVGLVLSEPVKPGTVPTLLFNPPTGSSVPLTVSGSESNWSATLSLTPAMGSGFGSFSLIATDALNNVGQLIASGDRLEIYNTALPTPPGQPVGFQATALAGGAVRLHWNAVSNAEIYSLYREPGSNQFLRPTALVASGITSNSFIDLPPADGSYLFAVTASRRGAEGTNSITRVATSDRLAPSTPTNVIVALTSTGVQITWQAGQGETPARYNVYRNGALIRTVTTLAPVTDAPPRGLINYTVGAADALGNEALSSPASLELLVGAVNNLVALVNIGQAPQLTWDSSDATATGYNVYRNGIKQNATPIATRSFTDSLGVPSGGAVTYTVRAVNATNAESAPRLVDVYDIALSVAANFSGGAENALVNRWFDRFSVTASNRTTADLFPLERIELRRTIAGAPVLTRTETVGSTVAAGASLTRHIVCPAASVQTPQTVRVQAIEEADLGGSKAIYQATYEYAQVLPPGVMMEVAATQQPLAGGLATLNLNVFNKGYADMDLLMNRNGGSEPGDLYISVKNTLGQEVSRLDVRATPSGQIFTPDGRGFLRIAPGSSAAFSVSGILVPEALGTNTATFEAVFPQIYYRLGSAGEVVSGPLSGSMNSSLAVTPYFGTADTDKTLYTDEDPVLITGQAIDRQTGLPRPNVPLKLGFFIRGYKFYYNVTTDTNGSYSYTYNPPQGLGGTFKIWAAHPDVFDILNQVQVSIYRAYLSPNAADIRLTKNDRLPFTLTLINPGDETLTGFTLESAVYTLAGTNRIPNTNVSIRLTAPASFSMDGRETERVPFEIAATLDAPNNVVVEMTLRSAEGAGAKFVGNVSLLPANPILAVMDPPVGYVDLSVNRGALLSKTVTIANRGLRELKGVTLDLPTNVTWMTVSLPVQPDGKVHLPDLPVGASNSFTVVFSPPTDAALQYFQDRIVVRGTNLPAGFNLNLYALVTSSQKGNLQFFVDNILAQPVPNATVRIKNTLLQQEYVKTTDANGYVTFNDLQEGPWAWQATASGHATRSGVQEVLANQTLMVSTRLSKSLVTVNFSVVPVPFTDRYEIVVEQTFETHVPAPVLVIDPPLVQFHEITAPFEATFIARVKNEGLIQMTDVQITGGHSSVARLTPLINYFPLLRAQEVVEVPFRFVFDDGSGQTNSQPAAAPAIAKSGKKPLERFDGMSSAKSLGPQIDENGNITPSNIQFPDNYGQPNQGGNGCTGGIFDLDNFFGAIKAIISACAQCVDAATLNAVVGGLQTAFDKAKDKGKFDYWKVIETVVQIYELLGCPTGGAIGGGGGSGGGSSGDGQPGTFTQYGGGGGACFAAGTQVLLADGSTKAIEDIVVGDKVRTGAESVQVATVVEVLNREVERLYNIEVRPAGLEVVSATAQSVLPIGRSVTASAEHLFWVDGEGWVAARNLKAGQWLFTSADTRVQITGVNVIEKPARVYTFSNRGDNVFYANDILVRDSCGDKSPYLKAQAKVAQPSPAASSGGVSPPRPPDHDAMTQAGNARIRATIIPVEANR